MNMEIMKMGLGVPWSVRSLDVANAHLNLVHILAFCVASLVK